MSIDQKLIGAVFDNSKLDSAPIVEQKDAGSQLHIEHAYLGSLTTVKGLKLELFLTADFSTEQLGDQGFLNASMKLEVFAGQETAGEITYTFLRPEKPLLAVFRLVGIRDLDLEKTVVITSYITAIKKRQGVATTLFNTAEQLLPAILEGVKKRGLLKSDVRLVRVVSDASEPQGWTTRLMQQDPSFTSLDKHFFKEITLS